MTALKKAQIALALLLMAAGLFTILRTVKFHVEPKPAAVSKAAPAIVNTVVKRERAEAAQKATVKEAVSNVKKTSSASDDMGDTGRAGLAGLCELRPYSEDPEVCLLLSPDPGRLEEAGASGAAAR